MQSDKTLAHARQEPEGAHIVKPRAQGGRRIPAQPGEGGRAQPWVRFVSGKQALAGRDRYGALAMPLIQG